LFATAVQWPARIFRVPGVPDCVQRRRRQLQEDLVLPRRQQGQQILVVAVEKIMAVVMPVGMEVGREQEAAGSEGIEEGYSAVRREPFFFVARHQHHWHSFVHGAASHRWLRWQELRT
jgi:hypothetical protein